MAGICIGTIKIIGVSSIGLLTGSLIYSSYSTIPQLIEKLGKTTDTSKDTFFEANIAALVSKARIGYYTFSSIASGLLLLTYKASSTSSKHPYLLYAALIPQLAIGYIHLKAFATEKSVMKNQGKHTRKDCEVRAKLANDSNTGDKSDDELQLGKSYIHVSEEDSSTTSTPATSPPTSPRTEAYDQSQSVPIDEEVEHALAKKRTVCHLKQLKDFYLRGAFISGLGFVVAAIGLFGDFFLI